MRPSGQHAGALSQPAPSRVARALKGGEVAWAGFHTFRHTCTFMLFERGANAVKVQRWLGHHSAASPLSTYVHLLADNLGEALSFLDEVRDASCAAAAAVPAAEHGSDG